MTKISNIDELNAYLSEHGTVSRFTTDANLSNAGLSNANLYGANLRGANLRDADLHGAKNIVMVTGVGSERRYAYFVNHDDCIMVQAGCFWGTIDELLDRSSLKNGENSYHFAGYKAAIEYAKVILGQHRINYANKQGDTQ